MYETKRRTITIVGLDLEECSKNVDTTYRYSRVTKKTVDTIEQHNKVYRNLKTNYRKVRIGNKIYTGVDRQKHHVCERDCVLKEYCLGIKCTKGQNGKKSIIFL